MRKYGIIIDEITKRAKEKGKDIPEIKCYKGRAQLLMFIASNFDTLYSEQIITLELLHEMYNEEELNRRFIYTIGTVSIVKKNGPAFICGKANAIVRNSIVRAYDNAKVHSLTGGECIASNSAELLLESDSKAYISGEVKALCTDFSTVFAFGDNRIVAGNYSIVKVIGKGIVEARDHTLISSYNKNSEEGDIPRITLSDYAICRHNGNVKVTLKEGCHAISVNEKTNKLEFGNLETE